MGARVLSRHSRNVSDKITLSNKILFCREERKEREEDFLILWTVTGLA